jgi:acetyl esterase
MPLDPAAEQFLQFLVEAGRPPLEQTSPDEARAGSAAMAAFAGEGAPVASVETHHIDGVRCEVVRPDAPGALPTLVWFHGGGWVIGSAESSVAICRDLAAGSGCAVVSVDYRLAPEHPAPAAMVDCLGVTAWVLEHGREIGLDPTRVAVGGDSAGGNLAALVALELGEQLKHQLLVYPATDLTLSRPSITGNGEGYLLTAAGMRWFVDHYLTGTGISPSDPSVSPIYASPARLGRSAPASVITAEFDPLRDEGEDYAAALCAAGVENQLRRFNGQIHAFFGLRAAIPAGGEAIDWAAARLAQALT